MNNKSIFLCSIVMFFLLSGVMPHKDLTAKVRHSDARNKAMRNMKRQTLYKWYRGRGDREIRSFDFYKRFPDNIRYLDRNKFNA